MIASIVMWLAFFQAAATKQLPEAPYGAPTHVDYTYPVPCDLSTKVLSNVRLQFFFGAGDDKMAAKLRNGKYAFNATNAGGGFQDTQLDSVNVVERLDGHPAIAVVMSSWTWGGGSSNSATLAQVFDCSNGRLHISQQIVSDDHGGGNPGIHYYEKSKTLRVRSVDAGSGPHCCPTKMYVITYRWNRRKFIPTSSRYISIPDQQ